MLWGGEKLMLAEVEALANRLDAYSATTLEGEFARGAAVLEEARRGTARFAAGERRHGT